MAAVAPPDFHSARVPDGMRVYAIGDVHGQLGLLEKLHRKIEAEIAHASGQRCIIVHVGDYVDRGPNSAGVLDFLRDATARNPDIIALAGNHDLRLLDLVRGDQCDMAFPRYGGIETAHSYGVSDDLGDPQSFDQAVIKLRKAVPQTHVTFLESLPLSVEFGDFFFCHAGIRPGVPLDDQDEHDLVWIRHDFLEWQGLHPKVIVHGHTPNNGPEVLANRVNIDTMAYQRGELTALVIEGRQKRFITAQSHKYQQ